jgi:CRISPR/Cas system-associated exonuclease Cas4 (RecB family)
MSPLTRGSLFHDIQARVFRALQARGVLPVTLATVTSAREVLDDVIEQVAAAAHDELVPAVERVWQDDVAALRRDLHAWLDDAARDGEEWEPTHVELAFGRVRGERDPASLPAPVTLDGGFILNGAIDLVEEHRQAKWLRVTDHKTGRRPERIEKTVVGGGAVLQPVLYAMVAERALGRPVTSGRLFYCTSAGGFFSHVIPLDDRTRAAGLEVLEVIDRAIGQGFLAASPTEEACARCDFRPVCGPGVFPRVRRKPQERLADLLALRSRP